MIRVVHGEDSVLIREGVSRILAGAPDLELVGTAEDFDGLRALVEETQPDVVVTDIRMPPTQTDEGIRMAVELNEARPEIGVVVLSQHLSKAHASLVFAGGAQGRAYVLKDRIADPDELVKIIRSIAGGEAYLDPLILTEVVSGRREADRSGLNMLSPREQEVLALLAAGQSNAAIARRLDVSTRAVERHVGSIFAKLGLEDGPEVSRRVQATLVYQQAGGDARYLISVSSLNIGRYIEMMIVPITAADQDDHDRLDDGRERRDRGVDLLLVEVGDLPEHRVELAGLLADLDHLADHRREDGMLDKRLGDRHAGVDLLAHVAQRVLDDPVARRRAGDLERLDDVDAGGDQRRERPCEPRHRHLEDDVADLHRDLQLEAVPGLLAALALLPAEEAEDDEARSPGKTRYQRRPHHSETLTITCVSVGSVPPNCTYSFWKIGTMKRSIAVRTRKEKERTSVG